MQIKNVMTEKVHYLTKNHRLYHALELMQSNGIRHVIIVDNTERLVGIISDRDIKYHSVPNPDDEFIFDKMSLLLTVDKIMSINLITCVEEQEVETAVKLMLENKISALPVVSQNDNCVIRGIVTTTDILQFLMKGINEKYN